MGTYVVTKPATEPVSIGEARSHLRLDTTDTDPMLAGYLLAARQFAEDYTRRVLMRQTWDVTFDDDWPLVGGRQRLDFPFGPVAEVTQITYTDEANYLQTLDPSQYLARGLGGTSSPYIVPAHDVTWPAVLAVPETIRVRFVAGYGTNPGDVPEPIRHAILFHTELLYDRDTLSRELLEAARNAMLDPYRLVRI